MVKSKCILNEKWFLLILGLFAFHVELAGQSDRIEGAVSFRSNKNVYVKFFSTADISEGDTLYALIESQKIPSLLVVKKSSISCICTSIQPDPPLVGDKVYKLRWTDRPVAAIPEKKVEADTTANVLEPLVREQEFVDSIRLEKPRTWTGKEILNGRLSVSTNGDIDPGASDRFARIRVSGNMNVDNIRSSRFSVQSYLTYRHRYGVDQVQSDFFDDFKVFTLSLGYALNNKDRIWLGRRINPFIANMGALDGVQLEKFLGDWALGILAGFRPDVLNYGLDFQSPQMGAFVSHQKQLSKGLMQSSLAFVEQRLGSATDRRFLYAQHSSQPLRNLNFFASLETDLYRKVRDEVQNQFFITSIYSSLRYRISRRMSIQFSYDNRRNVIYSESYRNIIDQLIAQETRQGFRLMFSYAPIPFLNLSASSFLRYQGASGRPVENHYLSAHYSNVAGTRISFSANYNYLKTDYLSSNIISSRITRDFFKGRLNLEANYRWNHYSYAGGEQQYRQQIVALGCSVLLDRLTSAILNYEASLGSQLAYQRYFITLQHRFKNSSKKK